MARRPVFYCLDHSPYYGEEMVTFDYNPGFADIQKQKNIHNIHRAFTFSHPEAKILEISSKSETSLGTRLSAFNLKVLTGGLETSLESAFQAGKVFRDGGPYYDLLTQPPWIAKKDPRLHNRGPIRYFMLDGVQFPTEPGTFFYDWLYVNAVNQNKELAVALTEYDAFTDVEFNPEKSLNCQARSAAIFVSLMKSGLLEKALRNPDDFRKTVYGSGSCEKDAGEDTPEQLSFF